MSDYIPMDQYQLLSFGFCRQFEKKFLITIPHNLVQIIMQYQIRYVIFGIGNNYYSELGIGGNSDCEEKWIRLKGMEDILLHTSQLYMNYGSIMISGYVSGYNKFICLGIDNNKSYIKEFTKIPKIASSNIISSHSMSNEYHTFVYINNDKLLASGNNKRMFNMYPQKMQK